MILAIIFGLAVCAGLVIAFACATWVYWFEKSDGSFWGLAAWFATMGLAGGIVAQIAATIFHA